MCQSKLIDCIANVEDEDFELQGHRSDAGNESASSDVSIHGVDKADESDSGDEFSIDGSDPTARQRVHILPLYSQLPSEQQMRVFSPPPDNSRLIVLATNVAETSLTIPGIRYVFDCGRAKEKRYDVSTGVQSFAVDWISKASASQRAGRAGRTGPGHCYRLYSSAVYEHDFSAHAVPEIQRTSAEGVVLQLKSMGIPNISRFPFPTPPSREALAQGERLLERLGAIDADGKTTEVGRELSTYPLSPRLSRILTLAQRQSSLGQALTIVAVLAVPEVFVPESQLGLHEGEHKVEREQTAEAVDAGILSHERRRKEYNAFHAHLSRLDRHSDAIKIMTTLLDFDAGNHQALFTTFTRTKSLIEATQLRSQLSVLVPLAHHESNNGSLASLTPPTAKEIKIIRHLIAAGYIDRIAQRADLSPTPPDSSGRLPGQAIHIPYATLFDSDARSGATEDDAERYVYIHASSVLAHVAVKALPQFVVYSHLSRTNPGVVTLPQGHSRVRTRMHPLTPATAQQIIGLTRGTALLAEGKPIGKVEVLPRGANGEERRAVWTVPYLKGSREWPLPPAKRIVQYRTINRGWVSTAEEGSGK